MSLQDDIDRQQRNKNPFHRFLLKHRPYCELCSGPMPAFHVIQIGFKDKAVCDAHFRAYHPIETGLRNRARLEANPTQASGEDMDIRYTETPYPHTAHAGKPTDQ